MGKTEAKHRLIRLKECGDWRGGLAVIEAEKEVAFKIRRIFYCYKPGKNVLRGGHANRFSKFGFISLVGSCRIQLDDGIRQTEYFLDSPLKLLYVDKMMWKVIRKFTADNVLLVLSDRKYSVDEYIKNYEEFKKMIRGKRK